jgi:hypothetical protein
MVESRPIFIYGLIGSGKTTLKDLLLPLLPGYQEAAFANGVKQVVAKLAHVDIDMCYTETGKNTYVKIYNNRTGRHMCRVSKAANALLLGKPKWLGYSYVQLSGELENMVMRMVRKRQPTDDEYIMITIGEMLQEIATDFRSVFADDIWIRNELSRFSDTSKIVIHDMRHKLEKNAGREINAIMVKVFGDPTGARTRTKRNLNARCETELANDTDWDLVVDNSTLDPALTNLHAAAKKLSEMVCDLGKGC